MKTLKFKPTDFYEFRKNAFAMCVSFTCTMLNGKYIVEANIDQLYQLGY